MPTRDQPLPISRFAGVNRRDGADLIENNEFLTVQNMYPLTKGLFYKREGSSEYLTAAELVGVQEVLAIHRFNNYFGEKETLFYCKTAVGSQITNPSDAPTVTMIAGGYIPVDGVSYGIYYSWVGRGGETAVTSSPINAILTAGLSAFRVGVPAFPTGVKAANIFIQRAGNVGRNYVGSITTSGTTIDVLWPQGHPAAYQDPLGSWITSFGTSNEENFGTGNLKAGTYYISACWFCGGAANTTSTQLRLASADPTTAPFANEYVKIVVPEDNMSIRIGMFIAGGASANSADTLMYFIGTKPPKLGSMMFAGIRLVRSTTTTNQTQPEILDITDFPEQVNAQSHVANSLSDGNVPVFQYSSVTNQTGCNTDGDTAASNMIIKEKADGTLVEVFMSRSDVDQYRDGLDGVNPFTGAVPVDGIRRRNFHILRGSDVGTMCSYQGEVYLANANNLVIHTDGFAMSEQTELAATIAPGVPLSVLVFKNQLVCIVSRNNYRTNTSGGSLPSLNQVFSSGVFAPNNWSDGGTGLDLRFATIGDPFSDGVAALGIYNFNSATDGPSSFLACFKKASTWLLSNVPDSAGGVNASANAISGRTGCVAYKTIVATNIGLVFLGTDGSVYLISGGGGEPRRIGDRIRNAMSHLSEDDELMARCTAVFHKGFYKISYPSSATSTTNDAQWWADLRTEQGVPITWSGPHIGINVGPQTVFLGDGDEDQHVGAVDGDNQVALLDDPSTFEDLGEPIVSVVEWKTSRMGTIINLKKYSGMVFDLYYDTQFAHDVMVEAFAGDQYSQENRQLSDGTGIWDATNFDQGNWGDAMFYPVTVFFAPSNLIGRTFRWKLTHSNNAQIILANAVIMYQPERRIII